MKKTILLLSLLCAVKVSFGQIYKITYHTIRNDKVFEGDPTIVYADKKSSIITKQSILNDSFKQTAEQSIIDINSKIIYKKSTFQNRKSVFTTDSSGFSRYKFEEKEETKTILGKKTKKATTSINSNAIEIFYTNDIPIYASPNEIGIDKGLVLEYRRNSNSGLVATKIEEVKSFPEGYAIPAQKEILDILTYRDEVWKSKFIQLKIFKNEKICFDPQNLKSDSILRFAEGTVIVKKVKIPALLDDSQAFIELIEKSNGDAYDRTGSVFLIADDQPMTF